MADWLDLPQPVELCLRQHRDTGEQVVFLLNPSDKHQTITLHRKATDLLKRERVQGTVDLEPFGVLVLGENDVADTAGN